MMGKNAAVIVDRFERIIVLMIAVVFLNGCMNSIFYREEPIDVFLRPFNASGSIEYVTIKREVSSYGKLNLFSCSNIVFNKNSVSTISISVSVYKAYNNETVFLKTINEYSNNVLQISRYSAAIEESSYEIDSKGKITLTQEFEDSIELEAEQINAIPDAIKKLLNPFEMIAFLIKDGSASFATDNNECDIIKYSGFINPDAMVKYYIDDGNDVFRDIIYVNYQGEIAREALIDEIIDNNYNTLIEPLSVILFANEPVPVTITRDLQDSTYSISIDITSAKNALYMEMYENEKKIDNDSTGVEESIIEYTNIIFE